MNNAYSPFPESADLEAVLAPAIDCARHWLKITADDQDKATKQLAELLRDSEGVTFTMDFVDRVMRPEDDAVAAHALTSVTANHDPAFLGRFNALLIGLGGYFGPILPNLVMSLARMRMRQMVGHLVLDAESDALNKTLERAAASGEQLNLNLLGEAVLGEEEARSRTQRTLNLIRNPRVTYVSVKATAIVAQLNPWDIEGSLTRLKERLRPLYAEAARRNPRVFLNLDMEEYHDLELTIRLFKELLSEPEFHTLEAGIVLQAYLPDTFAALNELAEFARQRVDAGGAKIKVRIVKGANLSMEHVESEIHGWPLAPYGDKAQVDANYYRLLDFILRKEYADCIRIGVATHNLYTAALAYQLGRRRGVLAMLDSEMLQGMSPAQQQAVAQAFGGRQILYTPVVHMEDFDVAVSYLVRRLEENSAPQNFLHSLFSPDEPGEDKQTPLERQEAAFRTAVTQRWDTFAGPHRIQNRLEETGRQAHGHGRFQNEPDTDPALANNRRWALEHLAEEPARPQILKVSDIAQIEQVLDRARELGEAWAQHPDRGAVLESIGDEIARRRGQLISVAAYEANKTVTQTDPEVSEAIDFCVYYAHSSRLLADCSAEFHPNRLTVVTPPWNFPVAIPTGGIAAALAAGSAVVVKPAPQVVHCATVVVEAFRAGLAANGQDPDLVQLLVTDEGEAGKALVSSPKVDAVILTGASETGALFRSWRPSLRLFAETSGKNALIISPAADPDLAIADLYNSAFGHSGQKCSAASLVIFVGAAGRSERLRTQLVDAVRTLKVGPGYDITTTMNGLCEPPSEKLLRGLTQLDPGEKWLLKPEKLNAEGTLWSPGIRDNVAPGSWYHLNECFGPVLGIMYADTLEQAVEWQNSTGFGLTGGIHSLDESEISYWMDNVEVGNAYVNRGITGAIVQRQSFGGWKKSVIGPGAKAGGPNYVAQLGSWTEGPLRPLNVDIRADVVALLRDPRLAEQLDEADLDWLWRAAELDQKAWQEEFGRTHDRTGLVSEANIFRYLPLNHPLQIRIGRGYALREVVRLKLAQQISGADAEFSASPELAQELAGLEVRAVADTAFAEEVSRAESIRVRTLGEVDPDLYEAAVSANSVIEDQPVLADGRRELLPFLLEQALSITTHRFGIIRPHPAVA